MFTGIISSIGAIEASEQKGDLHIKVASDVKPDDLKIGQSVAVDGVCLTITSKGLLASGKSYFAAALSAETVSRTAPGRWGKGQRVNLERALKLGDTLDGHMVTGHVDGIATIKGITADGESHRLELEAPPELARFIAAKGSVALDGVSLTVNQAEGPRFRVNIIAHTWQNTTLSERRPGDALNLEIDMLARYLDRLLQAQGK